MWVLFEMGNGKCNLEFLAPCGGAKEKRRGEPGTNKTRVQQNQTECSVSPQYYEVEPC